MKPYVIASFLLGLIPWTSPGDEFDRLEGRTLADIPGSTAAAERDALTFADLGLLPAVLPGIRSGPLVVVTGEGNFARVLAAGGLRRPPRGSNEGGRELEPIPVLLIERFDTFEAGPATTRLARGREIVLFDGFPFDLDTGQVVPAGQGGDIRFVATDDKGPRLEPVAPAKVYTLSASPLESAPSPPRPTTGGRIAPGDFAGRYRLVADGRWSGRLDLEVDQNGAVTGRFRSDQTGNVYRVTGQTQVGDPNRLLFAVEFPRSRQEYDARLWTEGKGALAGTVHLLERTYGFFAIRDGAAFAPEDADSDVRQAHP